MPAKIERFRDEFSFLSNFHPAPVEFEGITYPTVEHAFQAAKTLDLEARRSLAALDTPARAKARGRRVPLRPGWDELRLEVMEQLLRLKFAAPELRASLLATGDAALVEGNNWNDRFRGVCRGTGKNHLGGLLIDGREGVPTFEQALEALLSDQHGLAVARFAARILADPSD